MYAIMFKTHLGHFLSTSKSGSIFTHEDQLRLLNHVEDALMKWTSDPVKDDKKSCSAAIPFGPVVVRIPDSVEKAVMLLVNDHVHTLPTLVGDVHGWMLVPGIAEVLYKDSARPKTKLEVRAVNLKVKEVNPTSIIIH